MKTNKIILLLIMVLFVCLNSCKEEERYRLSVEDSEAPDAPEVLAARSIDGGVRFFYRVPTNRDVLAVKGEYTAKSGEILTFSSSFFKDSLDVLGFSDTAYHDVKLYAVNRAGRRSIEKLYSVRARRSLIDMVAETVEMIPAFGELYVDFQNELNWNVSVIVNFTFTLNSEVRNITQKFTTNAPTFRGRISDLENIANNEMDVMIRVEDLYGNQTNRISYGKITLLEDMRLNKRDPISGNMIWTMPYPNDSVHGIPQFWGNFGEGRNEKLIDDIIDGTFNLNFCHTNGWGRIGRPDLPIEELDVMIPPEIRNNWNVLIDLGDYYELSRVVTHQRHDGGANNLNWGFFYGGIDGTGNQNSNVGRYGIWILDETVNPPQWELIREHSIPIPIGLTELEVVKMGRAGDLALLYPDEPKFSPPTRWFRYEARGEFRNNYAYSPASNRMICLSEITLYGRKAQR